VAVRGLALVVAAGCNGGGPPGPVYLDAPKPLDAPDHPGAGPGGGILTELRFAICGDTRPAVIDDTPNYPTAVATQVWADVAALSPLPQFAVTTGDYQFASTDGSEQAPQLDLYLSARAAFPNFVYPTMGNHECTGFTDSNCGPGAQDGEPPNYTVFMQKMVMPIGEANPYFIERFAAADGSWTAKLVDIAANAWTLQQSQWLEAALSEPTTYTFVARHEPIDATSAPGTSPSTEIIARYPLTLLITGHTHTYGHDPAYKQIIVGNGGAPLTSDADYGYVVVVRQADATLQVTSYDYANGPIMEQFVISADGLEHNN